MLASRPDRSRRLLVPRSHTLSGSLVLSLTIAGSAAWLLHAPFGGIAFAEAAAAKPSSAPAAQNAKANPAPPAPVNPAVVPPPANNPVNLLSRAKPSPVKNPSVTLRPFGSASARNVSSTPAMVSIPSSSAPLRGPAARPASQNLVPQDEQITYHYNALGRRDPFQPLLGGGFVGADEGGKAAPDVGGIKVVGIVWGANDKFALVEDPRGNSMVLRQGDKVMNGYVSELKRNALVVKLSMDGQTQSVEIPLASKGEKSDGN